MSGGLLSITLLLAFAGLSARLLLGEPSILGRMARHRDNRMTSEQNRPRAQPLR